ncbi:SRPBCC domain-containing protein [Hyphomicrobium sp.]|uniref:SRPBCC domain-containing protein n=1 Tax=Hyphomicrobium sp. TaxID=82 RepID=UPI000FBC2308|nr:SRPBCC domain-containing protein [Hyphomicrobium sp.]RUP10083.1 MAG: SRPBCC domain-containing protein [Hyphomicrobium sp.]
MARAIETSILIAAPASRVWSVLMDFGGYPAWNPFIRTIKGEKQIGARLEVGIEAPGLKAQTFRPVVVEVEPERAFSWRGSLPIPGLFVGVHRFALKAEGADTRFEHSERFSGLLIPFVGSVFDATERGFRAMNEALKAKSEGR